MLPHSIYHASASDRADSPTLVIILIRIGTILAVVGALAVFAIVRPLPVVTVVRPLVFAVPPCAIAAVIWHLVSTPVGGWLNDGATGPAELLGISPQASHDPVHIGNLRAAEPPDIGRTGHLLLPRPSIFRRERRVLNGDSARD